MSAREAEEQQTRPTSERLRVAQVVTRMDIGGVPDHIMTLVRSLRSEIDFSVVCGSIEPGHARELGALGVDVILVPMKRLLAPISDLGGLRLLISLFRSRRFDVVHSHMSKAALLGGFAAALAGVPVSVNTAHNLGFLALTNRPLRGLFWAYDKTLFAMTADAVITVSERVRQAIVASRIAPARKVFAVHNGIETEKFQSAIGQAQGIRAEFGVTDEEVLVVTVARLVWFKGLKTLVEAAAEVIAKCPKARFLVIGDGPQRAELDEQVRGLGLQNRVTFAGARHDVPAILAAADIFALTSVSEGLPISILEAMAAGKPVVATSVGGIPELIEPESNGLLARSGEAHAVAAHLIKLVGSPELRSTMGERGRERALQQFSPEQMGRLTAEIYWGILRSKGPQRKP